MSKKALSAKEQKEKVQYRVKNWSEYDVALVKRGNVTVWFVEDDVRENWKPAATVKRGAVMQYSDRAIQTLLVLKSVFSLTYRSLEGFGCSLMMVMGLNLRIPDHSHLSRRVKTLNVVISRRVHDEAPARCD